MESVVTGPVLDEVLTGIKRQAQQLETTRLQLSQHIRSLGLDRDKVVSELQEAQKELAGVKAKLKTANEGVAELIAALRARQLPLSPLSARRSKKKPTPSALVSPPPRPHSGTSNNGREALARHAA